MKSDGVKKSVVGDMRFFQSWNMRWPKVLSTTGKMSSLTKKQSALLFVAFNLFVVLVEASSIKKSSTEDSDGTFKGKTENANCFG